MLLLGLFFASLGWSCASESDWLTTPNVECSPGAIDLVFVMDQSDSVGKPNFEKGLEAVIGLTNSLKIGFGPEFSHVGFVRFGTDATVDFGLNTYYTNSEIEKAIRDLEMIGGGTNIADGMDKGLNGVIRVGGRPQVSKVMVLITDGNDQTDVAAQHAIAEQLGVTVYAMGIGNAAVFETLVVATGNSEHVYMITDYDGLAEQMSVVCEEIATMAPPTVITTTSGPPTAHQPRQCPCRNEDDYVNVWLDIIFILDSSNGAGRDFTSMKELLISMAAYYPISQNGGKFSRIAIINTAEEAEVFASLSKYDSGTAMRADVDDNLKHKGGDYFSPTNGLIQAQGLLDKDKESGKRLNVKKVVVLFTTKDIDCIYDGKGGKRSRIQVKEGEDDPCRLAAHMVIDGVTLLTVALSIPGEEEPVVNIATPCFNTTNNQGMVPEIMRMLCMANCYCLPPFVQYVGLDSECNRFGECVYVDGFALAYAPAKENCRKLQSTLSDILSRDKEQFLTNFHLDAGFFPYWVGMERDKATQKYMWDSLGEDATDDYSRWGLGEPNLAKGDCVYQKQYKFNTTWASDKCGRMMPTYFFSCQKKTCDTENYCDYE